jgi:hypothetical protein
LAHPWHPAGLGVAPGEQHGGRAEDRPGDDPGPVLAVADADAGHGQGESQQDAEQNGPGEQGPDGTQQRVPGDRRPILLPLAVTTHHRERHAYQP